MKTELSVLYLKFTLIRIDVKASRKKKDSKPFRKGYSFYKL